LDSSNSFLKIWIILLAVVFSKNRNAVNWKLVGTGLGIQFILAVFILKGSYMEQYWSPLGWPKDYFSWILMAAPAALVISKILYPELDKPLTMGRYR
jgi:nucleoside permease NupC